MRSQGLDAHRHGQMDESAQQLCRSLPSAASGMPGQCEGLHGFQSGGLGTREHFITNEVFRVRKEYKKYSTGLLQRKSLEC
jgi:hypothetical protein